jgi:flagellar biosynthesis protein FlhA
LISLSPKWEQAFAESLIGQGDDRQLTMPPSRLSEFITLVRDRFEEAARQGESPVLVTSPAVRPFVRSIVERFRTQRTVAIGNPSARAAQDGEEYLKGRAGGCHETYHVD